MIYVVINKGTMFLVREIGRVNRVAVLSRDKTDISRGGGSKRWREDDGLLMS